MAIGMGGLREDCGRGPRSPERDVGAGGGVVRGGANWRPAVGGLEECVMCRRRFRVETLEDGAFDPTTGRWDVVALGNPGCSSHSAYYPRCWDYWSPDEEKWFEALDEAISNVFLKECLRLFCQQPEGFTTQLGRAFDSIERLQSPNKQPRYDEWDAPLYVSWYQARQVHLLCAILKRYPPPPSGGPLRVVDVGCGAWAVPIALAMLAVRGHRWLCDCQVSIHGFDSSGPMMRIGRELWREFRCAAKARGLDTRFADRVTDRIITSAAYPDPLAGDASAESWLLAIHAVYGHREPQRDVRDFLQTHRTRHASRLQYEILTTDRSKRHLLESLVVDGSGRWIVPQPIWKGNLSATTGVREELHKLLEECRSPMTDKHMNYLKNPVRWDPSRNPIQRYAVWVWKASQ
ncbi:MAG: hypothetical protein OXU69_12090 [Gemmatimonadota bacterium]|nr:hypothetical protein [Gemmatimonadota bacterium]MDE2985436.1 hypothetical protein [Gemmatimonadota bacterium]